MQVPKVVLVVAKLHLWRLVGILIYDLQLEKWQKIKKVSMELAKGQPLVDLVMFNLNSILEYQILTPAFPPLSKMTLSNRMILI